ncbi:MAG: hypothetical protein WBK26_16995 [Burkholderiaceae bacterium]
MTEVDVCEFNAREGAKFALDGLMQARARAHALLLVLLGGGAGMASTGVGLMSSANPMLANQVAWSAVAGATWWFLLAAWVALRGLQSAEVTAWAAKAESGTFEKWQSHARELAAERGAPVDALAQWRLANCDAANRAATGYRAASGPAYRAADVGYRLMSATPLVWAAVCAVLYLRG